ncbi:YdcF family protein [Prochlorothrix hollandica]|uniref:YdcF family protein n=1 Tax=Prochlorothrix hollandica TaxID=1223 RepID=UPI00333EF9F8
MFFFLSKLLPLFIYPLGLVCALMVVAAVVLRRWPSVGRGCLILGVIVLWGTSTPWAVDQVVGGLERQYQDWASLETLPQAEAIVILGGATAGAMAPRVYPEVLESGDRLLHGARLYQAQKAPLVILSGGRVQWQVQTDPDSVPNSVPNSVLPPIASEAEDMATLLQGFGVPGSALVLEPQSLNTYQNALYTAEILRERQLNTILLVTSAIHMPRALAIFRKQGLTVSPAPTDFLVEVPATLGFSWKEAVVNLLPDAGNQEKVSRGLKERLGLWVYGWRGWL